MGSQTSGGILELGFAWDISLYSSYAFIRVSVFSSCLNLPVPKHGVSSASAHLMHGISVPCCLYYIAPCIWIFLDQAKSLGMDCFKPMYNNNFYLYGWEIM